eukprot:9442725-Prorocentrum_lima.AAC.1
MVGRGQSLHFEQSCGLIHVIDPIQEGFPCGVFLPVPASPIPSALEVSGVLGQRPPTVPLHF